MTATADAGDDAITVVGAGPAGLASAIVLARAGKRVVVRERWGTVGHRFHGDYQGIENWSEERDVLEALAEWGVQPTFDCHPVYRGTAFDAWGECYPVASEAPLYYLVRRGDVPGSLDRGLLAQARSLGVEVRFHDRGDGVAGPAVYAGGPRTADVVALGYVFRTEMPEGHWICFDGRLAPSGYAYLLVYGGEGTLATVLYTDFRRAGECLARSVEFFHRRAGLAMREPRRFGGYGSFRLPRAALSGGHPVVGEEAGFQDWLAGFGLRYAVRSGVLAARCLLDGVDYPQVWRAEFLPSLRAAASNRLLYAVFGDRGMRWMLKTRLAQKDARAVLFRLYNPSLVHRLAFPLALWRYRRLLLGA